MDMYNYSTPNQTLPHYEYYLLPFEKSFNIKNQVHWFNVNQNLCNVSVVVYLVVIALLRLFMRNRSRLELRIPVVVWNTALALFSFICVIRIMPDLLYDLTTYGYAYTVCDISYLYRSQTVAYWGTMFVYSKLVEFGDTVFLVLRKRQLTFLHLYHHMSIAIACWFFVSKSLGCARWVPVINGSIHTFMYTYFALKVLRINIPKWMSMILTGLQICQMMFALFSTIFIWSELNQGKYCAIFDGHVPQLFLIGFSYFALFCNFFYQTYLKKDTKDNTDHKIVKTD